VEGLRLAPRSRRRVPHLLAGVVLLIVCAVVFFEASLRASGRVGVLVLARDVTAGQVLTTADLRVAQVAAGPEVGSVPAGDVATVVGARIAVPRPAGAVLTRSDIGQPGFPPAGKAIVAVALKAGQFPPGLTAGANVAALVTAQAGTVGAATATGRTPPVRLGGVVVSVTADASTGSGTVVALLMDENAAASLGAAAAGTVTLLQLSPAAGTGGG
jgi:hypothetical protein